MSQRLAPAVIAVVFAAVALTNTGRWAFAETNSDSGFQTVEVDLAAGTFNKVLPFDIPFQIIGKVPSGTKTVTVQYVEDKEIILLQDDANQDWQPEKPLRGNLYVSPDDNVPMFRVTMPRIEAQRYYAFKFDYESDVTPEHATTFATQARETIDLFLRGVTSGDITTQESRVLRNSLVNELLKVSGGKSVIVTGTIFDLKTDTHALLSEETRAVLNPQLQRRDKLQEYGSAQNEFRQQISAIQMNTDLGALITTLDETQRQTYNAAIALTLLSDNDVNLIALGQGDPLLANTTPTLLITVWQPDQVADFVTQYSSTLNALGNLNELVRNQLGNQTAVQQLTQFQLDNLNSLIGGSGALRQAEDSAFRLQGIVREVHRQLMAREKALESMVSNAKLSAQQVIIVNGSTTGNYDTFQSFYVSADAGFVFAPDIDELVPYIGTNIYLRPVNKDAPLAQLGSFRDTFSRRFAITVALTLSSVADENDKRADLFGDAALLVGVGFRATDSIRVGLGYLVFKENDPNGGDSIEGTPYLSVSFDWNIAKGIGNIFPDQ